MGDNFGVGLFAIKEISMSSPAVDFYKALKRDISSIKNSNRLSLCHPSVLMDINFLKHIL